MTTLQNFPMVSQRDSDKNADLDCVPACIAAAMDYLTGRHYTASEVKDAVYGTPYTGGTAAIKYVEYCQAQGVKLYAMDGNGAQLVADLKSMIASGHPCLITEPDPYMPPGSGYTHVCAAFAFDSASITVMDPWTDSPVKKSDGQWASQLQDNQIWILERSAASAQTSGVPDGWKDDGEKLTAPNGIQVVLGFRAHVLASKWNPANGPLEAEYHADPVLQHNPGVGSGQRQLFRDCLLWWTKEKGVVQEPYIGLELDAAYKASGK